MVPAGFHGVERIAGHAWRYESRCLNRDNTDVISKKVEYFKALDLKNRRVDSIPIASISEALEIFLQLARILAKLKVSGLRRPRLFRLAAARRPTSIRRVLS